MAIASGGYVLVYFSWSAAAAKHGWRGPGWLVVTAVLAAVLCFVAALGHLNEPRRHGAAGQAQAKSQTVAATLLSALFVAMSLIVVFLLIFLATHPSMLVYDAPLEVEAAPE